MYDLGSLVPPDRVRSRKRETNAKKTYRKRKENVGLARVSKPNFWQASFALAKHIEKDPFSTNLDASL